MRLELQHDPGPAAQIAELQERDGRWTVQGDPTEGALVVAAAVVVEVVVVVVFALPMPLPAPPDRGTRHRMMTPSTARKEQAVRLS